MSFHSPGSVAVRLTRVCALRGATFALAPLVALMMPTAAQAQSERHVLRIEAAGAAVLGEQSDRFNLGGGVGASYEFRFIDVLGVEARYAAFFFPEPGAAPGDSGFASYQGVGLGLRVHPLPQLELGDLSFMAGANAVFTGAVTRPGVEVGAAFEFRIIDAVRLGPVVRYAHVFESDDDRIGRGDAGFLQFGVSAAFILDASRSRSADVTPLPADPEPAPVVVAEPQPQPEPEPVAAVEPQPEPEPAPTSTRQASSGERELEERIYFALGETDPTPETMDEIRRLARQINSNPQWGVVVIEGHASRPGDTGYNLVLSARRANRVRNLLIREGVSPDRLVVEAYGSGRASGGRESDDQRVVFRVRGR